jgi:hypothetical protein
MPFFLTMHCTHATKQKGRLRFAYGEKNAPTEEATNMGKKEKG